MRVRFLQACLFLALLLATALFLSACNTIPNPPQSAFEKPKPKGPRAELTIFYPILGSSGGYLTAEGVNVAKKDAVPEKAVKLLLTGKPKRGLHGPYIPSFNPKTRVRGVKIKGQTATIDFNRAFLDGKVIDEYQEDLAVAALVNTMSQFPKVKKIMITVEGKSTGMVGGKDIETFWGKGMLKNQPFSVTEETTKTGAIDE